MLDPPNSEAFKMKKGEFTETQYPAIDGKTDKVALIRLHE